MNRIKILFGVMLICLTSYAASAQSGYAVKGIVVDELGPVIGAAVVEVGTTNGTSTGLDGDYTLTASSADAILEISCIGYASQRFAASAMPATVVLKADAEFLTDAVVIGYGTVKKEDMTGSVVAIQAEELNRGAVNSPSSMLLGKVSGLNVTPASGQPGASSTIRIRGAASLTASNDPLIVIDGVPVTADGGAGMGDPLATVNPNDIDSYSVLKDASATAIYGSRASNGVIIITTKKGKGHGVHVSYNGTVAVKQNASTLKMMDGPQFEQYINEYRPEAVQFLGVDGKMYNTDWQKEIYRIALNLDRNLSVYGGGKFPFRVSLGYNLDQATIKTGDNRRANMDLSLSPKFLDDHLSVSLNAKGVYQHTNWANNAVGSALSFDPTKPIYFTKEDGRIDCSQVSNGYWNWMSAGTANTMAGSNPLSSVFDYTNYGDTFRVLGNLELDYKIHGLEDLRAHVNLGYDESKTDGTKYNRQGSISAMRSNLDLYETYSNYNRNTLLEAYANYNHTFADKHNLDAVAGYSWQHNYVKYDDMQFLNNDNRDPYYEAPTDAKEYYLISFFGRANYSFNSKYLFTVTARADASSRFSPKNRWGFFPAAAFAWNAKNEGFLKNVDELSSLKLRLGWGRTGQQDIGSDYYPYLARYFTSQSPTMQYPMGGTVGSLPSVSPLAYNPNIKWETTETYNVGIDWGFIDNRISGTVEAYYRKTYDLLNNISIPLGSNFGKEIISNIGEMINKGIELSINTIPISTQDHSLEIGGNITFQDVKIAKLTNDDASYLGVETGSSMGSNVGFSSLHRAGYAPYTYYLYQQVYDENGVAVQNALVDRNGDGVVNSEDRYITGCSPTPWAYYGVTAQYRYKNWDFGFNGHGAIGAELINKNRMGYTTSYSDNYTKGYITNLNADFLIPGWHASHTENQKYSDLFIEDATFFKIDDINVGYTFNLENDLRIRVAGSVQNVWTFTKYSGLDPEIGNVDGVDTTIFPRPRLYTVRLNINF